jgi:excisionase family DNA binding protein
MSPFDEVLSEAVRCEVDRQLAERIPPAVNWYSVATAATYASMSEDAIRSAEKRGQLRGYRSETGRVRFSREALDAFVRGEQSPAT